MSDFGQHLENELSVTGKVIAGAPSAIWNEISNDWQNDKGKLAERGLISAGIGFAATVALRRSPVVAGLIGTGLLAVQGIRGLVATGQLFGDAWDANTAAERDAVAKSADAGIGKEGALWAETLPGMIAGGGLAKYAANRSALLESIGTKFTIGAEFPARKLPGMERLMYRAPGSFALPEDIVAADGRVDALKLSDILAEKTPWKGVEAARSVNISDAAVSQMRATTALPGTAEDVNLGFYDKPGRILFHTHEPAWGPRPSKFDIESTDSLGIIQSGEKTAFYSGHLRQLISSGDRNPPLRALILDKGQQRAFVVDSLLKNDAWTDAVPKYVDYSKATEMLKGLDLSKVSESIGSLPASTADNFTNIADLLPDLEIAMPRPLFR